MIITSKTFGLILFMFATLSFGAMANSWTSDPEPFVGTFEWDGLFEPVMKIDVQVVSTKASSGRAQLAKLRGERYRCQSAPNSFYRCSKILELDEVPQSLHSRLAEMNGGYEWLQFVGDVEGLEHINKGESFMRWLVTQQVQMPGASFTEHEFWSTPTHQKVVFRSQKTGDIQGEFNLGEEGVLYRQLSTSKTLDRFHFQIFVVRLNFTPRQ